MAVSEFGGTCASYRSVIVDTERLVCRTSRVVGQCSQCAAKVSCRSESWSRRQVCPEHRLGPHARVVFYEGSVMVLGTLPFRTGRMWLWSQSTKRVMKRYRRCAMQILAGFVFFASRRRFRDHFPTTKPGPFSRIVCNCNRSPPTNMTQTRSYFWGLCVSELGLD